jgi:ribosomal protein S27AE
VLGWLTRLFGKRAPAEGAPAGPPAPVEDSARDRSEIAPTAVHTGEAAPSPAAVAIEASPAVAEAREVCPTCGKTSVFAGPPGHRYCMHCALRQELFDASAAANH